MKTHWIYGVQSTMSWQKKRSNNSPIIINRNGIYLVCIFIIRRMLCMNQTELLSRAKRRMKPGWRSVQGSVRHWARLHPSYLSPVIAGKAKQEMGRRYISNSNFITTTTCPDTLGSAWVLCSARSKNLINSSISEKQGLCSGGLLFGRRSGWGRISCIY